MSLPLYASGLQARGLRSQDLVVHLAIHAANGLTISIPKTEIVVFGGGHHDCVWMVAGQHLKRSKSFTYLGMLFHEDSMIRHAVQARFSKACASVGSIF